MKDFSINLIKLFLIWTITVFLVASCGRSAYANGVHPHGELALVDYQFWKGAQSARTFFVRKISMRSHLMAKFERSTFECARNFLSLSINPFQLCYPHLAVNSKAPLIQKEHINHA